MSREHDAIRARVDATTPGQWRTQGTTPWGKAVVANASGEMFVGVSAFTAMPTEGWSDEAREQARTLGRLKCADAEFIAHAPNDVRTLLDELDAAYALLHRYSHPTTGVPYCGAEARSEMKAFLAGASARFVDSHPPTEQNGD